MRSEVMYYLSCKAGKIYVDCTLGGAGHAGAICEKIIPNGLFIGIDQDKDAIINARKVLQPHGHAIHLFHDNFANLPTILAQLNIASVDGILLDLGLSLHHLENSGRGFSFKRDEPLDMRMNRESSLKAEDIITTFEEGSLIKIFKEYGEERRARKIAKKIVEQRQRKAIRSSRQLAEIVCSAVPAKALYKQRIHPATRVFMALRIAVNKELERLELFMENVVDVLNPKGRLVVLSFHSLEDRIVKQKIKLLEKECLCPPNFPKCVCTKKRDVRALTRKAQQATMEEIAVNPMARSAKLRAAEKI